MTDSQAKNCAFNPFDLTKVWLMRDFSMIKVGIMTLNENPKTILMKLNKLHLVHQT